MIDTACNTLAERFEAKRAAGLVDIKFYVRRETGADVQQVYDEAEELFAAIEAGVAVEDFEFGDRH